MLGQFFRATEPIKKLEISKPSLLLQLTKSLFVMVWEHSSSDDGVDESCYNVQQVITSNGDVSARFTSSVVLTENAEQSLS